MAQNRREPRIFVVDDETFVSASLARILRLQGFDARAFDKPFDALQAAVETPPDMLITDVMMRPSRVSIWPSGSANSAPIAAYSSALAAPQPPTSWQLLASQDTTFKFSSSRSAQRT